MLSFAAVVGLCIGSFLNVVVSRVPRGESVLAPPSRCPRCDAEIRPRDNIPVVSWALLRARCRACSEPISVRYPLVELTTASLFVGLTAKAGLHGVLPAYLYLGALTVALALIDLDTQRLPNALVLPSYGVVAALLVIAAVVDDDADAVLRALIGMAVYYGFFFALWFAYPKGMGFGDVKLAGVLGLVLGYVGYDVLAVGVFGGILLGGIVGIGLMVFSGATRKTKVPYGPFMLAGALLAVFVGVNIAHAYTHATGVA